MARWGSVADWAAAQDPPISRVAAYKRIRDHKIPMEGTKLDLDLAQQIWDASKDPAKVRGGLAGGAASTDNPGRDDEPDQGYLFQEDATRAQVRAVHRSERSDLGRAQLARTLLQVEEKRLALEERRNKLVSRDSIKAFAADLILAAKSALEQVGAETCEDLAHEDDPILCRQIIDARIESALRILAKWKPEA